MVTYTLTRDTQTLAGNILIDNALINGDNIRKRATSDTDVVFVNDHGKIIQNPGHVFKANLAVTLGK
ncbi:MAG: hypothetical protein EBX53_07465, partial [Betaproteobacteria bacterium]|nr:hypothetical protein [Betaproteobacteria bacterium]